MEKDILEIIDTAVKIGLGALISGASTYILSKSNYNQEKEKTKRDKHIEFLEEISIKLEEAKQKIEEAAHPYWLELIDSSKPQHPSAEVSKQSIDLYLKTISIIGQARALTYLLDITTLSEHLDKLTSIIQDIYQQTALDTRLESADETNKKLKSLESIFSNCFKELGNAYKIA